MDSIPIPEKYWRRVKPLSQEEIKALDKSAFVGSLDEALKAIDEKKLEFPILLIPQGAEHSNDDLYVANDDRELQVYFEDAKRDSLLGKVHVISRKGDSFESGRHSSFL